MQYTPRINTDATIAPPVPCKVTLPAVPFDIPKPTTDETAPRSLPVRGKPRRITNIHRLVDKSERFGKAQYEEPQELVL